MDRRQGQMGIRGGTTTPGGKAEGEGAAAGAAQKRKSGEVTPKAEDPDAELKKRAKKDVDSLFAKAKMAKTKMLAAQAGYTDLMKAIEGAPEWEWAARDALKNPATEARDALESFKNRASSGRTASCNPTGLCTAKKLQRRACHHRAQQDPETGDGHLET